MRQKSLHLSGAGHSGSTLLGLILGSHSSCFYAGECAKVRYLGDPTKPERKRVCKICGAGCPIWSAFEWDAERPLYGQIGELVGRPVIVDSTKNPEWIRARLDETAAAGETAHLVLLTRDGRAVINSRLRKYPERQAEGQIRDWMRQVERSVELFEDFEGPKWRLRYEELAADPERAVTTLCGLLGLSFEPEMLHFHGFDHHPLGGNNGTQYQVARARHGDPAGAFVTVGEHSREYYERHDGAIRLDLRWKHELAPDHLALFERLAGTFNEPIKWEV